MNKADIKDAFEKWSSSTGRGIPDYSFRPDAERWEAWQAAWNTRAAQIEAPADAEVKRAIWILENADPDGDFNPEVAPAWQTLIHAATARQDDVAAKLAEALRDCVSIADERARGYEASLIAAEKALAEYEAAKEK